MSMLILKKSQLDTQQLAILAMELQKQKKSTSTAYLLLVLLGFLGVHRFYIGDVRWGRIYAMTLGLAGVGILGDLFFLDEMVRKKNEDIEGKIIDELAAAKGIRIDAGKIVQEESAGDETLNDGTERFTPSQIAVNRKLLLAGAGLVAVMLVVAGMTRGMGDKPTERAQIEGTPKIAIQQASGVSNTATPTRTDTPAQTTNSQLAATPTQGRQASTTLLPTAIPPSTATPEPTWTPLPTATTAPTATPQPTATPVTTATSEPTATPEPTATSTPAAPPTPSPAAPQQIGPIQRTASTPPFSLEVALQDVSWSQDGSALPKARRGYTYVTPQLRIKNLGPAATSAGVVGPYTIFVRDTKRLLQRPNLLATPDNCELKSVNLTPGAAVEGCVAFEVPISGPLELIVAPHTLNKFDEGRYLSWAIRP